MRSRHSNQPEHAGRRVGVARVISKAGYCSRTEAARLVAERRVAVNDCVVRDAEHPVVMGSDSVSIDGKPLALAGRVYLALNKPRGVVTTVNDEQGRETVYRCLEDSDLPWVAPVGRLDRASEGLLLFSNDPEWAARVASPETGPDKMYHVQIDRIPDATLLAALESGRPDGCDALAAKRATLLRAGERNAWLEIVLDEGRNRQIRRLLEAFGVEVRRLVRVAIGPVVLGDLQKGKWRNLTAAEVQSLATTGFSEPIS